VTCRRPATKQNLGPHAAKISVPNIVDAVELGDSSSISSYYFAIVERSTDSGSAQPIKVQLTFHQPFIAVFLGLS